MRFPFVRELRWLIWTMAALSAVVYLYAGIIWASPFLLILALVLFISRRFPRELEAHPLAVRAPVDGLVLSIEQGVDPFYDKTMCCIRLQQNLYGEYVLHSPIEGRLVERWWPRKSGNSARHFGFAVQADEGDDCIVNVADTSQLYFKTHLFPSGRRIRQAQRCGLTGLGVPVDVYIDETAHIKVKAGEIVRAGETLLATFKRHYE